MISKARSDATVTSSTPPNQVALLAPSIATIVLLVGALRPATNQILYTLIDELS